MRILCAGGASYIGAWMIPHLLAAGHKVTVYDTLMFGDGFLPRDNGNLKIVKADVRDQAAWRAVCEGQEAVIYLASISRELLCQQNPELAHAVNVECFRPDVIIAKHAGVKRFIYASSVAIYGSSEIPSSEDSPIKPTTIYGEGKAECEKALMDHQDANFCCTITRSASVCGYSPRMRLDLTINRMVHDACRRGIINVEGGSQVRSHVHIKDLSDFYKLLLAMRTDIIAGQAFNVVAANLSINETARIVSRLVGNIDIIKGARVDDRSYLVSGEKAWDVLNWWPTRSIESAVIEMKAKFDSGYWQDSLTNPIYQNMI